MAEHLRTNALLSAQACDGDQTGRDSPDSRTSRALRVGEQAAVFVVDDEDGQVRVCFAELTLKFRLERPVDFVPERSTARVYRLDVGRIGVAGRCRVERGCYRCGEGGAEGVEHVDCAWDLGCCQRMRLDACCVAHTPLKPMHFRPISRINSAVATLSLGDWELVLVWYRAAIDSGEFMVIVAAVVTASHDGRPSLRAVASCSILLYTAWILGGAGTGPGREWAALMSDLRAGESLDMVGVGG
jgi:hypothetical protein